MGVLSQWMQSFRTDSHFGLFFLEKVSCRPSSGFLMPLPFKGSFLRRTWALSGDDDWTFNSDSDSSQMKLVSFSELVCIEPASRSPELVVWPCKA